jgi:hypothetical protein
MFLLNYGWQYRKYLKCSWKQTCRILQEWLYFAGKPYMITVLYMSENISEQLCNSELLLPHQCLAREPHRLIGAKIKRRRYIVFQQHTVQLMPMV